MLTPDEIKFIAEHENDDTSKLLFASKRYPGIDVAHAAVVIEARRKVKDKIGSWYNYANLDYSSSLSIEQCSSEATALYKQRFVRADDSVIDLTGGLGVDSYFISKKAASLTYVERNPALFETVKSNFALLKCDNVKFINSDCKDYIANSRELNFDLIYIDPARRDAKSNRVYSIEDCEPDLTALKDDLFKIAPRILAKVSPMADVSHTLSLFPECREIHIVAVDNECKEVLICLERDWRDEPEIVASNIHLGRCSEFRFKQNDEKNSVVTVLSPEKLCDGYIYQPNKAILKAGAFRLISQRFGLEKLAPSTHLYYSVTPVTEFPGREFKIKEVILFNKEGISTIRKNYPSADCLAVNFPLDTNALRKKLGIREGGSVFLIATSLSDSRRVIAATLL